MLFPGEYSGRDLKLAIHLKQLRLQKCAELYRGADKSLAQPGKKQATATEDFDVHISYL